MTDRQYSMIVLTDVKPIQTNSPLLLVFVFIITSFLLVFENKLPSVVSVRMAFTGTRFHSLIQVLNEVDVA